MKTIKLDDLLMQVQRCLEERDYSSSYIKKAIMEWEKLKSWCSKKDKSHFSSEVCYRFLDETYGFHILPKGVTDQTTRAHLRYIRILSSYLETGEFEFRTEKKEYIFSEEMERLVRPFINHCYEELANKESTAQNKLYRLCQFSHFLEDRELTLEDLSVEFVDEYINSLGICLEATYDIRRILVHFFTYSFEKGLVKKNYSGFVARPKRGAVPEEVIDTYSDEEIKRIIDNADRTSAIGKRNFVVILLASAYGLRSSDITRLRFSNLDWENNRIVINQYKTGDRLELPLIAAVGNAVIDYWKNGRPKTSLSDIIVVSHMRSTVGKPLTSPTIHSIVSKAMRKANIENWHKKKHGAHSLRHSIASYLLKKNASMPIISTILGHRTTETTKTYISIDFTKLRQCCIPMPEVHSQYYINRRGGDR